MDLQAFSDRLEITDRLNLYAELLDRADFAAVPLEVFAEDAYEDHGEGIPPVRGHEDLTKFFETACAPFESTMHLITNVRVELDGDTAMSRSAYLAVHWLPNHDRAPGRPADFVSTGVYRDHWRRTPNGWRISRRARVNVGKSNLVAGQRPEHLLHMAEVRPNDD